MKLPIGATVAATCGIAILVSLGSWQVQRLHWKNDIIERMEREYADAGTAKGEDADARLKTISEEKEPLGYVAVDGRLEREHGLLLGPRVEDGRAGYNLIVPMETRDGHVLLINAGWVNELWKDTFSERAAALPADHVRVQGVVRKPDWTFMTSRNSPKNDLWFRADIAEIAAAKGLKNVYPVMLYADGTEPPLEDVKPHEAHWLPRNKHAQYAIFWFAMAAALFGVYAAYVAKQRD